MSVQRRTSFCTFEIAWTSCPSGHWNTAFQDPGANHLSWFGSNPIPCSVARFFIQKSFRTSEAALGHMSHYTASKALTCCRCSRSFFNLIAKFCKCEAEKLSTKTPVLYSSTRPISKSQKFWTGLACPTIAFAHVPLLSFQNWGWISVSKSCASRYACKNRKGKLTDATWVWLCLPIKHQKATSTSQPQSSLKLPYHAPYWSLL